MSFYISSDVCLQDNVMKKRNISCVMFDKFTLNR